MITIKVPIYYSTLFIFLSEELYDKKKFRKSLSNGGYSISFSDYVHTGYETNIVDGGCTGLMTYRGGVGCIHMKNYDHTSRQIGFLVHEINHYVFEMLRDRGMSETEESSEAYTYLSGWIVEQVMMKVQTKYKFVKNKKTKQYKLVGK